MGGGVSQEGGGGGHEGVREFGGGGGSKFFFGGPKFPPRKASIHGSVNSGFQTVAIRAARLQNAIAPENVLAQYEQWHKKRRKRIRKAAGNFSGN